MTALQGLISLGILVFMVLGPINTLRVDLLRHRLFLIRTQLFNDAAAGRIAFDSPTYRYTRTVINGMLRFAHRISLSRVLASRAVTRRTDMRVLAEFQKFELGKSPSDDRQLGEKYLRQANIAVMKHIATSPFAGLVIVPFMAWVLMRAVGFSLFTWVLNTAPAAVIKLDQAAFEEGSRRQVEPVTATAF